MIAPHHSKMNFVNISPIIPSMEVALQEDKQELIVLLIFIIIIIFQIFIEDILIEV